MTSAPIPGTPSAELNGGQQPLAPPPGPSVRPPLRRSSTDKMAAGVCGGLAEHTGVDSLIWRVGFVALTFAGGAGILVYLLLWVLMPSGPLRPGDSPSPVDRLVDKLHGAASGAGMTPRGD